MRIWEEFSECGISLSPFGAGVSVGSTLRVWGVFATTREHRRLYTLFSGQLALLGRIRQIPTVRIGGALPPKCMCLELNSLTGEASILYVNGGTECRNSPFTSNEFGSPSSLVTLRRVSVPFRMPSCTARRTSLFWKARLTRMNSLPRPSAWV